MLARLVEVKNQLQLLLSDGSICKRKMVSLNLILKEFKYIDDFSESTYEENVEYWNIQNNKMEEYVGKTIAYVTNDKELVIKDFTPFLALFDYSDITKNIQNIAADKFMSLPEYAEYIGVNQARIKVLCSQNRFPGAVKIGRNWIFLNGKDTPYPEDQRMTNNHLK